MTRVVHVTSGLGIGGAETMLVQLACALQKQGVPQHVVSLRAGDDVNVQRLKSADVAVTSLNMTSPCEGIGGMLSLRRLVAATRPDVLQGWMYHGDLAALLAHALSPGRSRRKLFWNIRASNIDGDRRYDRLLRINAALSSWPDAIVANSAVGTVFHRSYGYKPRKWEVIPNGIELQRFRPDNQSRSEIRAQLGIDQLAAVAIHVARVDPMKNHAMFIEAMNALPQMRGIMVGLGTERLECPPNVIALGLRHDVANLYAAADFVVSTSSYGEGFSNVIAEGMSAGLVPIVTDVGDAAEIVGKWGSVVKPGDIPALADALGRELRRPDEERQTRGGAARRRIVEKFALDNVARRYLRLYTQ